MSFFLFLISLVLVVKGVCLILWPKKMLKMANDFLSVPEPRLWGAVAIAVGIVLLFAASYSILSWLIVLFGLAEIAGGIALFLIPMAKIKSHWFFKLSDTGYRIWGILVLVLGVIVFISRV